MKLTILVGSMTGTATSVAQAIQMDCADLVDAITVLPMDHLGPDIFDDLHAAGMLYLVCTSTFGSGDVPDNAQAFYSALDADPRYLGHVRYGVVALGDRSYGDTFAGGGQRFDARLQDLGAQRIGEICRLDAMTDTEPEVTAAAWCRIWLAQAAGQA